MNGRKKERKKESQGGTEGGVQTEDARYSINTCGADF